MIISKRSLAAVSRCSLVVALRRCRLRFGKFRASFLILLFLVQGKSVIYKSSCEVFKPLACQILVLFWLYLILWIAASLDHLHALRCCHLRPSVFLEVLTQNQPLTFCNSTKKIDSVSCAKKGFLEIEVWVTLSLTMLQHFAITLLLEGSKKGKLMQ